MKRILILEDDKFLVRVYTKKLEHAGYEATFLENGQDVVARAKEYKPDLIILDLVMPVKDGYSALGDLKKDTTTKDIPVIVVSNLIQTEEKNKIMDKGATSCFNKANLKFDELAATVNSVIGS